MSNLNVGVIIGRFQSAQLHAGHIRLIREIESMSDRVVIFLGVSDIDARSPENPLTFDQRKASMTNQLMNEFYHVSWLTILPLPNRPTNTEWSTQIDVLLEAVYPGANIILFGGRKSFIESYSGKFPTRQMVWDPPILDAGTTLRTSIKESNSNADFLAGQIWALNHQYPKVYPTVDVALMRCAPDDSILAPSEVLIIRRADTGAWGFPGGFVDPTDETAEQAAVRELQEETGLISECALQYICTKRIDDWRYHGTRDKIMTTFFVGFHAFGAPNVNPNEVQDYQWVQYLAVKDIVNAVHKPLASELIEYCKRR